MSQMAAVLSEARVRDYVSLLKPRVMSLVVFTGVIGLLLAPGAMHPFLACVAIFCIALGSGAAGAVNMWYDRDIDAIMKRTQRRSIPSGKVEPAIALEFAVILAAASVIIMLVAVNMVAAFLLLTAILFYVFVYTMWLKRSTPQNIVIGGAAGAFPPMIGWAAVTGSVTLESIVLFLIIFMWTPPHFWALSLYCNQDYTQAKVPMLPVTSGVRVTQHHILVYSIVLFFVTLLPVLVGMSGVVYGVGATILGARFLQLAFVLWKEYQESKARRLFKFSIIYLFVLFLLLIIDKWVYYAI
jgi:protoheme IX farnesyltransferase